MSLEKASNRALAWTVASFDALDTGALYEVLSLRQRVFVVEQKCAYLDCDGMDRTALHLMGRAEGGALVAYARLIPPGLAYREASFGRVVTDPSVRRTGAGRELVARALQAIGASFGGPVRINAQLYLLPFYTAFGFAAAGEPHDEDGIPHVEMLLSG